MELKRYIDEFNQTLGTNWKIDEKLEKDAQKFVRYLSIKQLADISKSEDALIKAINSKYELNKEFIKELFKEFALKGVLFNYNQKIRIKDYVNSINILGLINFIKSITKIQDIKIENLKSSPLNFKDTIETFKLLYLESEFKDEMCNSLFSAYIFGLCNIKEAHEYFSNHDFDNKNYYEDYYEHLLYNESDLLDRKEGLRILRINSDLINESDNYRFFLKQLTTYIQESYEQLSNHSYLSIYIDIEDENKLGVNKWEIFSDLLLFAEKFIEKEVKIGYFHPDKIAAETKRYIPNISESDFKKVNEGFNYKDCFILTDDFNIKSKDSLSYKQYSLLLLLEKNQRDERIVPCPSCRSKIVRGNSYPIIGVKSWECYNNLCPGKSKFNRGKRYSLSSLIRQEAIENDENAIPVESVRKWRLDVVNIMNEREIIDFLIKHYSLVNDSILISNWPFKEVEYLNRKIIVKPIENKNIFNEYDCFLEDGLFWKRFYSETKNLKTVKLNNLSKLPKVEIYNGDCVDILNQFEDNIFDGAVTSPPYYNAKSYSNWPNIYCYLYDMYHINKQVFRVLKPGGIYLFNIFDYFDNENTVVLSDMGKKRLALGAYVLNEFKKIGFKILGNIIWFKGEIQGKRNFNQGNFSPYYQAPLNSYEHIFILGKQPIEKKDFPQVLSKKPIFKIVKGKNIIGHEAPYPEAIPNLLFSMLGEEAKYILDPFGGTMTTTKAALKRNISSVSIEQNLTDCLREIDNIIREENLRKNLLF